MPKPGEAPKQVMRGKEKQRYNPAELSEVELQVHRKLRIPHKRKAKANTPNPYPKIHTFINPTTIHQYNPKTKVIKPVQGQLPPCIEHASRPRWPAWARPILNPYAPGVQK